MINAPPSAAPIPWAFACMAAIGMDSLDWRTSLQDDAQRLRAAVELFRQECDEPSNWIMRGHSAVQLCTADLSCRAGQQQAQHACLLASVIAKSIPRRALSQSQRYREWTQVGMPVENEASNQRKPARQRGKKRRALAWCKTITYMPVTRSNVTSLRASHDSEGQACLQSCIRVSYMRQTEGALWASCPCRFPIRGIGAATGREHMHGHPVPQMHLR
eukprot:352824-Chlamydomonas_euryale.AAC.7